MNATQAAKGRLSKWGFILSIHDGVESYRRGDCSISADVYTPGLWYCWLSGQAATGRTPIAALRNTIRRIAAQTDAARKELKRLEWREAAAEAFMRKP